MNLVCAPIEAAAVNQSFQHQARDELGQLLTDHYLNPEIGERYREALLQIPTNGERELTEFAQVLEDSLREVHADAHLRVLPNGSGASASVRRSIGGGPVLGADQRLEGNIAYMELLGLPIDRSAQTAMAFQRPSATLSFSPA